MLATSQSTKILNGVPTEVVIQAFSDRILVLITQLGKVGNLIQATMSPTEPLLPAGSADADVPSLPPPPPSIQLTPLLGNAQSDHMQTLHSLYASQVATLVWTREAEGSIDSDRRGVIVGIALQNIAEKGHEGGLSEHERRVFHGVMAMVNDLLARS